MRICDTYYHDYSILYKTGTFILSWQISKVFWLNLYALVKSSFELHCIIAFIFTLITPMSSVFL